MGTRLYVGNLSFSSTGETVREAFARIGEVTDVHIVTDRTSGQSRGFGFVTMGTAAAAAAIAAAVAAAVAAVVAATDATAGESIFSSSRLGPISTRPVLAVLE